MSDLLELIEEISKERFLEAWKTENETSGHSDQFVEDRWEEHSQYKGLRYYVGTITEQGLDNLVLWHHEHPDRQVRVKTGGELFWDVVSCYWQQLQNNQTDDCLERLWRRSKELDKVFQSSGDFLRTDYSLGRVFNRRGLAVNSDLYYQDHGKNKLYAGNFHRFPGYGLWMKEHGYQPIKVYYCEDPLAR